MSKFQKMLVLKGIPSLIVGAFTTALMVLVLVACLMSTGCGTVAASGYAKRTDPNGVTSEARYRAIGLGEKSAMALEGLGIDGDAEAPGVFLQKGNTEQDTTQLMQSLIQLGAILGPIVQQRLQPLNAKTGYSTELSESDYPAVKETVSTARSTFGAVLSDKVSEAKSAGKALVVVAENPACSYCAKFDAAVAGSTLATRNDIVFVREIAPWPENSALAWTGGGDAPIVRVTTWKSDGSVACDQKLNRPSVAEVETAIGACTEK